MALPHKLPYVGFGYDDEHVRCGVVGSSEYRSLELLLAGAPFLTDPGNEALLAAALNHFQHGFDYGVIDDPAAYRASFLERYAAEEELEWDQFQLRIGDFDLPDLSQVHRPRVHEGRIEFFAYRRGLESPYRVAGPADGSGPLTYDPLD